MASNLNLDNLMDNPGMDHAVKHVATARKSITWRGAPRGSIYRIDASEARVGLFSPSGPSFTDPIVISWAPVRSPINIHFPDVTARGSRSFFPKRADTCRHA